MPTYFGIPFLLVVFILSGCATIIHGGGNQSVGIASSPSGAEVIIDNGAKGVTPLNVKLDRDKGHTIVVKKEGYEEASATTSPQVSGWVWGNILIGGLIGLAIDFISGGAYNIVPENVSINLPQKLGISSAATDRPPTTISADPVKGMATDSRPKNEYGMPCDWPFAGCDLRLPGE